MNRLAILLAVCLAVLLVPAAHPAPTRQGSVTAGHELRTVLALYNGAYAAGPRFTSIHALAEMPLNHLGLRLKYHDIRGGFPPIESLGQVRGVLTWFARDTMPRPLEYLQWLERLAATGKSLVVIGALGALTDADGQALPRDAVNRAVAPFGWRYDGGWTTTTYGVRYRTADPSLVGFERPLPTVIPAYIRVTPSSDQVTVGLRVAADGRPDTDSALVVVGPRGGYVAADFAYFNDRSGPHEFRQWYLNPFDFFRRAFNTEQLPKPDTTTLSGRRIYYSHVDGDGWRNLTQVEPYRTRYVISARMVLDKIIRATPDLPVTVAAIGGDIDPHWHGTAESVAVAKEIYQLPQVEAATHTYSHPMIWQRFDPSARPAAAANESNDAESPGSDAILVGGVAKPRMYDKQPFTLALEVDDAARVVAALLPPGKRVTLMQWPGDTRAFESMLSRTRAFGLANINGGDTRFDSEFPSAAWVAPIGVPVGKELQIYASNSNENTYTDLWRDRFYGHSFLTRTVRNTGAPRRLKPFNLYYHMYSGERLASLNALAANIAYARTLPLAPVEASRFSRIAEGFFSTELVRTGNQSWRVRDRRGLQTLRFDAATLTGVDFAASRGVIGQRHELGSLFVALDEAEPEPVVALKTIAATGAEPIDGAAYLVESRWRVHDVRRERSTVRFAAEGYGTGDSVWQWPAPGPVLIRWKSASGRAGEIRATVPASGRLEFSIPPATGWRVDVEMVQER